MDGPELRHRLDALRVTYRDAAKSLGLSEPGLHLQMRGTRRVSRQTELLLETLEARRRSYIAVSAPTVPNSRPLINRAAPHDSAGTITSVDLEAISLRGALGDIDQFIFRHKRLGRDVDEHIRAVRRLLLGKLDGAELHQLDARRDRLPRLDIVNDD